MHQVAVATLYMLLRKAYDHHVDKTTHNYDGDIVTLPYDVWLKQIYVVHADYWFMSMELLALLILQFVKSLLTLYGDN